MTKTNLPSQEESKPEALTEHSYSNHPDWKWSQRIIHTFCWGGMLVSTLVIFLVLNVDSVRSFVSQPSVREFLLHYFPDAQLWVNATLKYKQEIVFLYVYRLFLWGVFACIIFYFYALNWNRMLVVHDLCFKKQQGKKYKICKKTPVFILAILVFLLFGYDLGMMFQGSIIPMEYDFYREGASRASKEQYTIWNSFIGLICVFVISAHLIPMMVFSCLKTIVSMIMCFSKKNEGTSLFKRGG